MLVADFFFMEVEARLVAAGVLELHIGEINETPDPCHLPDTASWAKEEKRRWLRKLATRIVDNYVLDKDKFDAFVSACESLDVKLRSRTGNDLIQAVKSTTGGEILHLL